MMAPLEPGRLEEDLRSRVFAAGTGPSSRAGEPRRVGLEIEAIPIDRERRRIAELWGPEDRGLVRVLRTVAAELGWTESQAAGAPRYRTERGEVLSFEPGGQIEWTSQPELRLATLVQRARDVFGAVAAAAGAAGIDVLYQGMDPVTPERLAPLQVRGERYLRMDRHFATIGGSGRRMMRQTAAIHVNLDWTGAGELQWLVANAMTTLLTAVFANSPVHAGRETGHRSYRAAQWRRLAPARSGVVAPGDGSDPVPAYLRFALDAPSFLLSGTRDRARPFRDHLGRTGLRMRHWREHLSTLFPEVRPRGYLEVRSFDAIEPGYLEAPVVLLAGILYDERALRSAADLLPPAGDESLERAGRMGLRDPELRDRARELVALALEGAERQPGLVDPASLRAADHFFSSFTLRGADPGDERGTGAPPGPGEPGDSALSDVNGTDR